MASHICLQCGERVVPRADGTCPICHGQASGAVAQAPTSAAERSFSAPPADPATVSAPANPYASPTADVSPFLDTPPGSLADMERVRREYLNHEASIQSIGTLYYLSAALMLFVALAHLVGLPGRPVAPGGLLFAALWAGFAAINILLGRGLRRLRPWVRTPVGIFAGLGLLGFPLGTLISIYILYLLFSRKGAMVFSPAYQEILRQTPHIRYRTSAVALGCLIVFVVLVVLAMAVALLGK
jgi:hypothetical protein